MKVIKPMNVIDGSRIQSFHVSLLIWLTLMLVFDGYDVVVYGAVVPALIQEWGISDVTAGAIGSYTVMGTVVGAILFGLLADKIGRKKIILLTTFMFSLFTFLSGFANGPIMFTIFRVIAGMGLGGVMPNVIALITEFAPKRRRTALVSLAFCGYSIGAIVAALTSRSLLPTMGWEPIFLLAGIPVLLIPFLMKAIPESIDFLLEKGKEEEAKLILSKLDKNLNFEDGVKLVRPDTRVPGSPVVKLFEEKRGFSTIMFWVSCFCAFILIYAMNTWLPRLMMQVGYDLSSSLTFMAVMQIGAIVSIIVLGRVVDKFGFKKVLVPLFFSGAIALALMGFTTNTLIALVLISIIGAASIGVQSLSGPFVSQYYPSNMRATAVGSTMGFGRMGGIVAPTFIGILLTLNLQPQYYFAVIGIAALIGGVAMLFVQESHAQYNKEEQLEDTTDNHINVAE